MTIGVPIVTFYQDCTNSVPIVKNSQTAKMTIGVPIVTCLHRVRRIHKLRVRVRIRVRVRRIQKAERKGKCNKNLAIANRSGVSCAHNTLRASIVRNITQ